MTAFYFGKSEEECDGIAKIPSVGGGPGEEEWAQTMEECIQPNDVAHATEFYALFPKMLAANS